MRPTRSGEPNELTKPLRDWHIHPGHFLLHAFMGVLIFGAGIGADLFILNWMHSKPKTVSWQSGEVQTNFFNVPRALPPRGVTVELGMTDDGTIVWRLPK